LTYHSQYPTGRVRIIKVKFEPIQYQMHAGPSRVPVRFDMEISLQPWISYDTLHDTYILYIRTGFVAGAGSGLEVILSAGQASAVPSQGCSRWTGLEGST
jgi:hypothetical protein